MGYSMPWKGYDPLWSVALKQSFSRLSKNPAGPVASGCVESTSRGGALKTSKPPKIANRRVPCFNNAFSSLKTTTCNKNVKIYQTRHKNLAWSTAHTLSWDFSCSEGYEGPTGFGRPNLASRIPRLAANGPMPSAGPGGWTKIAKLPPELAAFASFFRRIVFLGETIRSF